MSINWFLIGLFSSLLFNIILIFLMIWAVSSTHVIEELRAKLKNKVVLLLNNDDKWSWLVGNEENGLIKTKKGVFLKTPHSLLFDDKKIPFAIAKPARVGTLPLDVVIYGNKISDEGVEKTRAELNQKGGFDKAKTLNYNGLLIRFDNVRKFFNALSPSSVMAKINYEIARALEQERGGFLTFNNVLLILILLLGGAIAFAIIHGSISPGIVSEAGKHLVKSVANNQTITNQTKVLIG